MTVDHVAVFLPSLDVGGAEKVNVKIANELSKRGYRVDVLVATPGGDLEQELDSDIDVVDIGSSITYPWPEAYVGNRLRTYIDGEKPDVILASLALANAVAAIASISTRHRPRLILCVHAPPSRQKGLKYRISHALSRWTYEIADEVIAVSRGVKQDIEENSTINGENIIVIHNPVVDDDLLAASREPVDHKWFEEPQPVILNVGSMKPMKNHATLIDAFDRVTNSREARLVLIGEGGSRKALVDRVNELGISSKVDFLGEKTNPYQFMAAASVFVLSSRYEGLGNVLIEALACGCPVVSTDCPYGPAEVLENGEFGKLVPVGDPEALADAILSTLDAPTDPTRLKARASDFRVSAAADQYEDVLK